VRRARSGFTLLEVLAVVALTSVVIGVALDFYVDLSNASRRASDHVRDVRRATAVLDRVARDLEAAVLVTKPPDVDPIAHPWLFFAESRYAESGSDQIKFVARNHEPRSDAARESDVEVVAYGVRRAQDDASLELLRWSSPRLPDGLDRTVPSDESQGAQLLADRLAAFSLRFLDPEGEWEEAWDSTTLDRSSELPRAVEIQVAMALDEAAPELEEGELPPVFTRRVLLPVRPIDLETLLDPKLAAARAAGADDGSASGLDRDGDGDVDEDDEKLADEEGSGEEGEKEKEEQAVMDCSDPSSPIQARSVIQCINQAVVGTRVDELKRRFERYLNDPFCRWQPVIPPIIVHRSCQAGFSP
jgi:type II secretion system protein J